jgi:hypothetical protein
VIGPTGDLHQGQAREHGWLPMWLAMPFADHYGEPPGREAIGGRSDPWAKPAFFEQSVKRTIRALPSHALYVHDIEFEQDTPETAWNNPRLRARSGAASFEDFRRAYLREWGSWYALPAQWTRELRPGTQVGIYGLQPFRKDYYGLLQNDAAGIERLHRNDSIIWEAVDPHVDFYTADIYIFHDEPDSVLFMAASVEENFLRTRKYGDKPVYAYEWLRFHDSAPGIGGAEVRTPYLAEAMAIVPFFSGGRGIVLWGAELQPNLRGDQQPYDSFQTYMNALNRVASVSEEIGRGRLVVDTPAHELWKRRQPLVRRIVVSASECVVMAVNPWQGDSETSSAGAACGDRSYPVTMTGKDFTILHIKDGQATPR